ncbi:MAG: hypothetical protein R3C31_07910 [Hyphomonadaceae bacterium]
MSTTPLPANEPGRTSAFLVYALYLLSIPSAAVFALFGIIVALAARDGAGPLAHSHLEYQVRIWFQAFWWTIGFGILAILGVATSWLGVGLILLAIAGIGGFVLYLWFTVVSLFGLLALLDNRAK